MSIQIYGNEDAMKRVESSESKSFSFPFEAEISEQMSDKTLKQIGEQLTRQFSKGGAVGVNLIEIRFSIIFDSK